MTAIRVAYPNYYKNQAEISDAINLWAEMLVDDESIFIGKAVKDYIKNDTSGFPPAIGQIRNRAAEIHRKEWNQRQREIGLIPEPEPKAVPMPEEIRVKLDAFKKGLKYE